MTADLLSAPPTDGSARPLLLITDLRAGRIAVTGELDRGSAHHLLDALETLTLSDQRTWTVDAAGITFCDAEGLRVLAQARSVAQSRGRVLVLDRPSRFLLRMLGLVGMDRWSTGR